MAIDKWVPFKSAQRPAGINHFCNCALFVANEPSDRRVAVVIDHEIKYGCVPYPEYIKHPEWRDGKPHPWERLEWHSWEGGPLANEYGLITL